MGASKTQTLKVLKAEAAQLTNIKEAEITVSKHKMEILANKIFDTDKYLIISQIKDDVKEAMAAGSKHTYFYTSRIADAYCKSNNITAQADCSYDELVISHENERFFKNSLDELLIEELGKDGFNFTYVLDKNSMVGGHSLHIFWNLPSFIYYCILSFIDDYTIITAIAALALIFGIAHFFK